MVIRGFILAMALMLAGCRPGAPATTHTQSSAYGTMGERVKFLNQYVSFRRTYQTLDFDIRCQNNGAAWFRGLPTGM